MSSTSGLIGREAEIRAVDRLVERVAGGSCALVLEGEAGIGKTAVWDSGVARARSRGRRVLVARPVQAETSFAFAALGDLLRPHVGLEGLPRAQRRALEVALLIGDADEAAPDAQAVALAALGALRALAQARPVVVAVDDAQWLDPPSEAVLRFACRRLGPAPVGLLVTVRGSGDRPVALGLDRALEAVERLALGPLGVATVRQLLRAQLGLALPGPVLRRLHAVSGGNPFYALELGRAYRAGAIRLERGEPLPQSLDALVHGRLAALSPAATRALATAAALARPTAAAVAAGGGSAAGLAEAKRADVIEQRDGQIRFTHPLLAAAASAALGAADRRELHRRLAEAVREPEERARHLALAADGADRDIARVLEVAARRADGRGAPSSAAELYGWAARLTPPELAVDAGRRAVESAFCVFKAGDSRRARALLEAAGARMQAGPERARALIALARVRSYDDDLRAATELFEQAATEAAGDRALRGTAQEGLAATLFRLRERLSEAAAHAADAARAAAERGDVALEGEALGSRLLAEAALGRRSAAHTLERAQALQPACEQRRLLAQPLFPLAVCWLWNDRLEQAQTALEKLYARGREIEEEGSLPYVLVMLAQVACVRGDIGAARLRADEGLGLTEPAGQAALTAYLLALRGLADALAGDAPAARDEAERALALAGRTSGRPAEQFAAAALGHLELALGDAETAARRLAPQVAHVRRERIAEPGAARFLPDHVEALIALGERAQAVDLLDWYEGNAGRLRRRSALAAAARCRGLALASHGEVEAALRDLTAARALHDEEIPLDRGRTLLALGATLRRARQQRRAREELAAALACFEALGARAWAARARAELDRIGGRAPAAGELTPTERRVAALVAQGLATKQVATALFVSPKTIEGHLSRIYAKLGVHSRTELAHRLRNDPRG